jgi:iron-sulfur cluster assembly protein
MIQLTPSAAKAIRRFIKFSETPATAFRISVTGGGCSGLQYALRLEAAPAAEDLVFDVEGIPLLVDPASQPMLEGVTVDFIDRLTESGFKFDNPNAKAACGCGKSFTF